MSAPSNRRAAIAALVALETAADDTLVAVLERARQEKARLARGEAVNVAALDELHQALAGLRMRACGGDRA